MATKAERRNSTGNLHSEKPIDRLKREHFLNPDSDHVDLNLLLRAVLDINESLDAEESEAKDIAVNEQRRKCTEDQGIAKKPTKTDKFGSDTDSIRSSSMSISRTRPKSAVRYDDKRPPPPERKNMSFCNSRVDAIDRENLRLLQQISQRRQRPKSATVTKKSVSAPVRGQTSSQVNRQRFQQKVDMENQQILSRLQAVRPTRSLSKDFLMKEHSAQKKYPRNASKSRPSSAGSRTSSKSHLSRTSSEASLSVNDTASVASSRVSSGSTRSTRRAFAKPSWEAGW